MISIAVFFSELFTRHDKFIKTGDLIRRTKYGKTLQKIAESGGADIFYTGKMAKQVKTNCSTDLYLDMVYLDVLITPSDRVKFS